MNQVADKNMPIKGNPEAIQMFTDTVLKIIGMYLQQQPTSMIDYFLGINTVHKLIVADLATRWATDSFPEQATYKLADEQFRQAMKELRRNLPALNRNTSVPSLMEKPIKLFKGEETLTVDAPGELVGGPVVGETEPSAAEIKHVLRYGGRGSTGDLPVDLGSPDAESMTAD